MTDHRQDIPAAQHELAAMEALLAGSELPQQGTCDTAGQIAPAATRTITPPVVRLPALTSLPWLKSVAARLGDPTPHCTKLAGVDIGHVHVDSLAVSEVCVGFVMRPRGLEATTMLFTPAEGAAISNIRATIGTKTGPSRLTHKALQAEGPQVNTLVFRAFTLAYSFDLDFSSDDLSTTFKAQLILHDAAATIPADELNQMMQICLDGFAAAHDHLAGTKLLAPDAAELARHFA